MFLADFHIHSHWSDGQLSIAELVDLYGTHGFGAIAITDHLCEQNTLLGKAARWIGHSLTPETFSDYIKEIEEQKKRAWEQYRMVLIAGFELTKNSVVNDRSAHIVGLGIRSFIAADADAYELAKAIKDDGGVAIAAHPVATRKIEKQTYHLWNRRKELASVFDAWEVASGPYLFHEVFKSGLPMIASSDLHVRKQLSSWKTVLDCERHPDAILEAIRKQNLDFTFYDAKQHESPCVSPMDLLGQLAYFGQSDPVAQLDRASAF